MANKRISSLDDITVEGGTSTAEVNANDILPITDVDDTTGSPEGTTKGVKVTHLMGQAPVQSVAGRTGTVTLSNTDISGLGTAATSASTDFSPAFFSTVSETTAARTLSDSDNGKVIVFSSSSSIDVTIPDTLTSGFNCTVVQSRTGQVTVATSGSASVFGYGGNLSTAGQYATLNIIPTGSNAYLVEGDLGVGPFSNTYSLSLDGTNDYAAIGTSFSALSGNKSFCGWFNFNSVYNQSIWGRAGATNYSHYGLMLVNPGTLRLDLAGGVSRTFTISPGIATGTWSHIALTGDGTDLKLYINGSQVSSTLVDGDWSIGNFFNTGGYYYFAGLADEIGLWTGTTLSASDVSAIANTSAASGDKAVDLSTYTGLTHWWRFGDQDTSPTVSDKIGSNNLNLHGATFVTQVP